MNIDVKFAENAKAFSVSMSESGGALPADFGEMQGVPGRPGTTFTPFVSEDGVISWTNDGELENPKPVNIRGTDGYTPVKYKDYYTAEETQEIIDAVLNEALKQFQAARIGEVSIFANKWVGTASPYSQVVEIAGVTQNSQVDLTPSVAQLAIFHEKDLAFVTENDGGVVTVYAVGQKPTHDYTIQVTITEVEV